MNSLKPLELLQTTLNHPIETSLFLTFLKKEMNEENLLALMEIISIKKALLFTENLTKHQKDKIFNWTETFLQSINIDSKEQKILLKECSTIQQYEYSDNTFFGELFDDLQLSMKINLVDPYLRFHEKEEPTIRACVAMVDMQAKKIVIDYSKNLTLNYFTQWPEVMPERSPLIVIEELLAEAKELINTKKFWIKNGNVIELDYKKLNSNLLLQRTIELQKVSLKCLDDIEKLSFYVNIYNFMMLECIIIIY
jgi:hypothetical protein